MQPTLWDQPLQSRVRTADPKTSYSAARMASEKLPSRTSRILDALAVRDMTDDEICIAIGEHVRWWPSCKSARSLLKSKGWLEATGEQRDGQQVWRRTRSL